MADISLRPAGASAGMNPFASFGKGAGFAIKSKVAPVVDAVKKPVGDSIKYSKDFLMKFMDRYTKCPSEVQQSGLEVVIMDDSDRDVQRQALQRVAEDVDDRDWRSRSAPQRGPSPQRVASPQRQSDARQPQRQAAPPPPPQQQQQRDGARQQQRDQAPQLAAQAAAGGEAPKIVRAADMGLQAYRPGGPVTGTDRALRQIKGILNKLTPEKFDRLLNQLLEVVTTAEILKHTIGMVFENAVAQPTFVAMYADLCLQLSKELPQFPPAAGEDKPMTFKRVLLNTCQDEFEDAESARDGLKSIRDPEERQAAEKKVKSRTLGNLRLIAELFRKDVVNEKIIHLCLRELLEAPPKELPHEDNIEAVCEVVSISGKKLSEGAEDSKKKLRTYLARMEKLMGEKSLPSRLRFIIKDVLDLDRAKWVPRRETFTAKKISEVKAEAQAELGMTDYEKILGELPTLPSQQRLSAEDVMLLPPLRSAEDPRGRLPPGLPGMRAPLPGPSGRAPAPPAPAAKAGSGKALSPEELQTRARNMFTEYANVGDAKDALQTARELADTNTPQCLSKMIEHGLEEVFNALKERDQELMTDLLVQLATSGVAKSEDYLEGMREYCSGLEDLALDVPQAPALLGKFTGAAVLAGALPLDAVVSMLSSVESCKPRRDMLGAAFSTILSKVGVAKVAEVCGAAGFKASAVLASDPEFDADEPSLQDWLASAGLTCLPL